MAKMVNSPKKFKLKKMPDCKLTRDKI